MIAYFTDIEGRWDKLEDGCRGNPAVQLVDGRLVLAEGATLVFGGDAVDRGPAGHRVVRALLDARGRYGDRVVLLAGNRDLNKLRLASELTGRPHPRSPPELHRDRPGLLRWIFQHTMGAGAAFANRAAELAAGGLPHADEDVVESFVADAAPGGTTLEYLRAARLAWRSDDTLFVHGAVTAENLGVVPGRPDAGGVDAWVAGLNAFLADELGRFDDTGRADVLMAYQAPLPGTRANQRSVVYGRMADAHNDPRLPAAAVVDALRRAGIRRVAVGHTPAGDSPALLRDGDLTVVMADNSYGRVERGARVLLGRDRTLVAGACLLDDGREVAVEAVAEGPVGSATPGGDLVKAVVDGQWLVFRALPDREVTQRLVAPGGPLGPPARL